MTNVLKCKMCGGDIEVKQDVTVGTCQYCGSTITLPNINSEKKVRLFNRANEYRINCEFDKAYDAYKIVVDEDEQEAEAYWGMVLAENGIEYVVDPNSQKRIPTIHRVNINSIKDATNYKLAIKHADSEQKFMYEDEVEQLEKLRRKIFAISDKVEPYDVFICYKETDDATGTRTKDSVTAYKIYEELEKHGIKTFFARVSLENHLGENYEPYIFAALKSARVMLLVTTSSDNCDAVWVKNEWSRFLKFMSEDSSKRIIPVYEDMSPYELPADLAAFQAVDISKIGADQDLVHGIQKILGEKDGEKTNNLSQSEVLQIIKEDKRKRLNKIIQFIKKVIIIVAIVFVGVGIYNGAKFVNIKLLEPAKNYKTAMSKLEDGEYDSAMGIFDSLGEYKDSTSMVKECRYRKASIYFDESNYVTAKYLYSLMLDYKDSSDMYKECVYKSAEEEEKQGEWYAAINLYKSIDGYKDSEIRIEECKKKDKEEIAAKRNEDKRRVENELKKYQAISGYWKASKSSNFWEQEVCFELNQTNGTCIWKYETSGKWYDEGKVEYDDKLNQYEFYSMSGEEPLIAKVSGNTMTISSKETDGMNLFYIGSYRKTK